LAKLLNGGAVPAVGNVPPDHPWFGNPAFKIKYDPEQAKKLLAEAGYSKDKPLKLKVAVLTSVSGELHPLQMNEFIKRQYAEVGVDLEFQAMDWKAFVDATKVGAQAAGGYDAVNIAWNTMDPHNALIRFIESEHIPGRGANWGFINDPEFDRLAKEARGTADPKERDAVLAKIHAKMVDDAVFVWFVHGVWPIALSPKVKGHVHPRSWYVDFSPVTVG
jgi:ABC-type transport system substrate-binding protein